MTIATLTGENGILTQAQKASEETKKAETLEEVELAVIHAKTKKSLSLDEEKLKEELTKKFGAENTGFYLEGDSKEGWTITIVKDKVSYFVDSDGGVLEIEYEEPINNSESLILGFVDDLGTRSTIYLYNNTDKIKTGKITITMPNDTTGSITAIADTTTISSDSNYITYTVTENGTYTFKATNGTTETETKIRVKNIETFKKVDDMGLSYVNSENKAYSYKGAAVPKGYYVDTKSNVSTGLVITDDINKNGYSTGNEWVWVPVNSTVGNNDFYVNESGTVNGATSVSYSKYGKLYSFSQAKKRDGYGSSTFYPVGNTGAGTLCTPSQTSGFREPSLLTDSTYGDNANITSIAKRDGTGNFASGKIADVATQYITDYNNMVTSVGKYGGFYIGRYELANISETAKEQPGDSYTSQTWFSLYNKCLNLNKSGTATETSMIYGSLWDATLQWLSSKYNVGYTGNTYSGYGNYYYENITVTNGSTIIKVKSSGTSRELQTGQTSYTKSNNIYDLSGNYYEWTQEAEISDHRVFRGGCYEDLDNSWTSSSARIGYFPNYSDSYISSRPQLYIK